MTERTLDTSKLAIVYLRQSTPGQVRDNVIATEEQYKLREIPQRAGFPDERIIVVDEDLGVSGATIAGRRGMMRVIDLLERGGVACVVVRDVSRLTRNEWNTDIGLIAEACFNAGAVIITRDKTYDPADQQDRFLLGLQGVLAGWDHGNISRRLEHHRRARQARGVHINGAVPAGYEKVAGVPKTDPQHGKLRLTDDEKVRERILLVLQKGLELGGVMAVLRHLTSLGHTIPVMGTRSRRIEWVPATRSRVTNILKNPVYAGAIVNGRRARVKDKATGRYRWETRRSYDRCLVMRDAHPAYITWDEHLRMLDAIKRNNAAKTYNGGAALASGLDLLRCGVCGEPLVVAYNAPQRVRRGRISLNTPYYYTCTRLDTEGRRAICQNPAGPYIDGAIACLIVRELQVLDFNGLEELIRNRDRQRAEELRRRQQHAAALERRAAMAEGAVADASSPESRRRLVLQFERVLRDLEDARRAAAAPVDDAPAVDPAVLARLELLREPRSAWARLTLDSRKQVLRALVASIAVHPDLDGYFVVLAWRGTEKRAAAKVKTVRRRKVFPVPEDVLAMFGSLTGAEPMASADGLCLMEAHSGTGRLGGRG